MQTNSRLGIFASLVLLQLCALPGCKKAEKIAPTETIAPVATVQPTVAPVVDNSMTPEAFLQSTARSDLFEIKMGKLAMQIAEAQSVKDFGQRMAANHTAIQVIISKIAKEQSFTLPTSMTADDSATVERFSAMQGVAFDKAYMTLMAEIHPKALALFRWQYENCTDIAVKPFAVQTMPIIGTHVRVSEQLNAEVNKEELRIAAELKAAELKAAEQRKADAAAAITAANAATMAKNAGSKKSKKAAPPVPPTQ
jgi:putative membrane protein